MTTVLEDRLARLLSDDVHLRKGSGKGANGTIDVCAVQAADWLAGGSGKSDSPECVSRKIAVYVIRLNDSLLFKEHRDLLKPYCAKLVGTAGPSGKREVKRAYLLADYAIRVFAPIWLRADPKHRFDKHAAKLEALKPITTEKRRETARAAARAAASAADVTAPIARIAPPATSSPYKTKWWRTRMSEVTQSLDCPGCGRDAKTSVIVLAGRLHCKNCPWSGPAVWTRAHREQLWALMERPTGTFAGDTISHGLVKDLCMAGYATKNPKGTYFSTPKGERALRDGLMQEDVPPPWRGQGVY